MKLHTKTNRRKGGFSLAELMVVIVIIGLLATLVARNVIRSLAQGFETKAKADITTLMGACQEYAITNGGRYPDSLEQLVQEDEKGYTFLDAEEVPTDPWENPYQYEAPGPGQRKPLIYSFGSDGTQGGEGDAADIRSDEIK